MTITLMDGRTFNIYYIREVWHSLRIGFLKSETTLAELAEVFSQKELLDKIVYHDEDGNHTFVGFKYLIQIEIDRDDGMIVALRNFERVI